MQIPGWGTSAHTLPLQPLGHVAPRAHCPFKQFHVALLSHFVAPSRQTAVCWGVPAQRPVSALQPPALEQSTGVTVPFGWHCNEKFPSQWVLHSSVSLVSLSLSQAFRPSARPPINKSLKSLLSMFTPYFLEKSVSHPWAGIFNKMNEMVGESVLPTSTHTCFFNSR